MEVRDQLLAGSDLATTAKAQSVDPNTASEGGILGCSSLSDFPALAPAITNMPVGQLSQPVGVGLVWYVVKVTKLQVTPLAQAEPTVVQDVLTQYGPFNMFLAKALATAKVSIDGATVTSTGPLALLRSAPAAESVRLRRAATTQLGPSACLMARRTCRRPVSRSTSLQHTVVMARSSVRPEAVAGWPSG
ncbi:MAG: peptidylprolyl isomerase [Actinomycetota bacterium]|nr:peptidylprolyl isomerase [Actinomycetota bacterium]